MTGGMGSLYNRLSRSWLSQAACDGSGSDDFISLFITAEACVHAKVRLKSYTTALTVDS